MTPNYNKVELSMIEEVYAAFPRVDLNTEVAICVILVKNGKFSFESKADGASIESFFRGVDHLAMISSDSKNQKHFFPSNYKPKCWWNVNKAELNKKAYSPIPWMTPYGYYYYFPLFLLDAIDRIAEKRSEFLGTGLHLAVCKDKKKCNQCWEDIKTVPKDCLNPLNKKDLDKISRDNYLWFLIFLSQFTDEQKIVISNFADYVLEIGVPNIERGKQLAIEQHSLEKSKNRHLKTRALKNSLRMYNYYLNKSRAMKEIWSFK